MQKRDSRKDDQEGGLRLSDRDRVSQVGASRSPARGTLRVGETFADRYVLVRHIATGGMGTVWEATDSRSTSVGHERVALKVMTHWCEAGHESRERFRREIALTSGLMGPHFPRIIDYGFDGETPYYAMELLHGETLHERIRRDVQLSITDALCMIRELGEALAVAHSFGVAHRDITPKNIYFSIDATGCEVVKVLDFGIARHAIFSSKLTRPGTLMGCAHYMSPEQARSGSAVDGRSDLWSAAVVLYQCLVGRRPFEGPPMRVIVAIARCEPIAPSQTVPALGDAVDAFFRRALARDPSHRYPTARALVAAFERAVSGLLPAHGDSPSRAMGLPLARVKLTSGVEISDPGVTRVARPGYESFASLVVDQVEEAGAEIGVANPGAAAMARDTSTPPTANLSPPTCAAEPVHENGLYLRWRDVVMLTVVLGLVVFFALIWVLGRH